MQRGEELLTDARELASQELLQDALLPQLIESGYRCHVLDAFWLRLNRLAAARVRAMAAKHRAGASALTAALRQAQRAAALLYYGSSDGGDGESAEAGSLQASGSGDGGDAQAVERLAAALQCSLAAHPPPRSGAALHMLAAPPAEQQYSVVPPSQLPPLARATDFSGLPRVLVDHFEAAPEADPQPEVGGGWVGGIGNDHPMEGSGVLAQRVLRLSSSGRDGPRPKASLSPRPAPPCESLQAVQHGMVAGAVVCEILYRLHRVR